MKLNLRNIFYLIQRRRGLSIPGSPKKEAAHIAVTTVSQWLRQHEPIEVVFNVFTEEDRIIYERELVEKGE